MPRRIELPADLKTALGVTIVMLLCAELLGLIGSGLQLHEKLLVKLTSGSALYDFGSRALHFVVLFLFVRPGWRAAGFVTIAGLALNAFLLRDQDHQSWSYWTWVNSMGVGFGLSCLCAFAWWVARGTDRQRAKGVALLAASVLISIYMLSVDSLLVLVARLHPQTYDFIAYLIDGTLGFQPSAIVAVLMGHLTGGSALLDAAYSALGYGAAILYALQLRDGARTPCNIYTVFVMSVPVVFFLYQLCPIAGPRYAFGIDFPLSLPDAASLPASPSIIINAAARNAMPSMHLGWSLLLWMNAGYVGRWARAGFAVLVGLTVLATLGLGEHYLVDLAAGVPAAVALQAMCTRVLPWNAPERRNALLWGAALVAFWIIAVRLGVEAFLTVPGLTWAAMLGTVAACVALYRPLARASRTALTLPEAPARAVSIAQDAGARRELRAVWLMFVLSGFAGLVYQVLFSKALALSFGSTAVATYTVLATYMGGMALGAWLGGRLAAQRADALKLYAYCELGIGAYCLATPWIFQAIQALYVALAAGSAADAAGLTVLRVLLGAAALSVPTVLMGMTLPILARFFQSRSASLGTSVALLYGANTVGAALGALLAGYLVIPALGMFKTTLSTALLNLVVAALALRLFQQLPAEASATPLAPSAARPGVLADADADARRLGWLALLLLALGGVVTLALEVNYMHLLAVVAGNSVYAFSLMLFAFLLGLAGGAEIARWLLAARAPLALCLAWIEFALAAAVLLGVYLWGSLPGYFASFAFYPVAEAFGTRELIRGLVCVVAMLPPALAIGALYPLAMEAVGRAHPAQPIRALGHAAALNTAGNIVGVLLAGFVLLPAIGALRSVQGLAALCLLLGASVVAFTGLRARASAWAPAALVAALFALQPASFDYSALASGANVYFAPQHYGPVIDHAESADGGLTTVAETHDPARNRRLLTLLTNGKFQGSNDPKGEMIAQIGFAVAPLLHTPARSRALVIGYGTGVSSRTLHEAGFASLDIVELSADIVRLADTHFSDINATVSTRPGVHTHITDGRNFLLLQERAYDLVSMEISSIWFAGAASLYNREFYQLVKKRLRPDGVLQQWVQLHHVTPLDLLYILGSVHAEFSHVWLYYIGGQGIIVASNDPRRQPAPENFQNLQTTASFAPLLRQLDASYEAIASSTLLDPAGTERMLAAFSAPASRWISTDDNLFLEYSTPKGNVLGGRQSLNSNVAFLRRYGPDSSAAKR
jgi:predicted membrane-bound spermidine synthase